MNFMHNTFQDKRAKTKCQFPGSTSGGQNLFNENLREKQFQNFAEEEEDEEEGEQMQRDLKICNSQSESDETSNKKEQSLIQQEKSGLLDDFTEQRNRLQSYSYFNLLPEANPIQVKSQNHNGVKFKSIQSIFQLKGDDHFPLKGQILKQEPLFNSNMNQTPVYQNQHIQSPQNLSNSSSLSSLLEGQNKNIDEQIQTYKDEQLSESQQDQIYQLKQNALAAKGRENGDTFQNNRDDENQIQNKINMKLIYKKQGQHMLVNLQSGNQGIKDHSDTKLQDSSINEQSGVQEINENQRNKSCVNNSSIHDERRRKDNLQFESKFESGNLASAWSLGNDRYNLIVQQDINTNGYTQWFYFKVSNQLKQNNVHFTIGNFYKSNSLFQKGMKISVLSKQKLAQQGIGWHKGGYNIKYSQQRMQYKRGYNMNNNNIKQNMTKNKGIQSNMNREYNGKCQYILSFYYNFSSENDETYFAYNIPYTYSQLQNYLLSLLEMNYNFLFIRPLCHSLLQNQLYIITITNPIKQINSAQSKKGVFITARVHPGETVSSYALEGLINFLISDSEDAYQLREQFIFKIVPMLNPDGVVHGNYRCSLAGCDLNRRWRAPTKNIHPEIYYTKRAIFEFNENYPLIFYCDLHGHSRKKDFFLYGCEQNNDFYEVREFAYILSKLSKFFDFKSCNYNLDKSKDATSRQTLFRDLSIENIYTLETSFCGPSNAFVHFSIDDLKSIGHSLGKAIQLKFSKEKEFLLERENINILELYEMSQNQMQNQDHEIDGSDSEPSCDNLDQKQLNNLLPKENDQQINKKKKKKNVFQKRMLLTNYFSKSPIKEKKEDKNEEKAGISERRYATSQQERRQPIQKTQEVETILNSEVSPQMYNFISNSQKKTPTKALSGQYSAVSPTIFQQINNFSQYPFNPQQSFMNTSHKQKQVYYRNDQYQQQKAFYLYQSQIQQQQKLLLNGQQKQFQQRQFQDLTEYSRQYLEELGVRNKTEEDMLNRTNFQISKYKRSETPQPHRCLSSSNHKGDSLHRNATNNTLLNQDIKADMQVKDIPPFIFATNLNINKNNNYQKYKGKNENGSGNKSKIIGKNKLIAGADNIETLNNSIFKQKSNEGMNNLNYSSIQLRLQQHINKQRKQMKVLNQYSPISSSNQLREDSQMNLDMKIPLFIGREEKTSLKQNYSKIKEKNMHRDVLLTDGQEIDGSFENKEQIEKKQQQTNRKHFQSIDRNKNQNQFSQTQFYQPHSSSHQRKQQIDKNLSFYGRNSSQGNPAVKNNYTFTTEQERRLQNNNQELHRNIFIKQKEQRVLFSQNNNNSNLYINQLLDKFK